ncbi:branched-chain amino acid ABC transporter permease [Dietzia sp. ANT_WB102]|uniref:branched-chain amino acid ABC transporter permease n=1 Tax=Dietzia sp. ANT_WB102 TaxID=2597345 RepID=UPI00210602FB|nr:branched-chain amino acid ABC transporter permease [Dietzia sp. ANT_WB102]
MSTTTQHTRPAVPPARAVPHRSPLRSVLGESALCLVVVAGVLAWMGPSLYRQDLVFLTATYALVALGMYLPFVLAGSLSMAYSAYAAIGAYAVAYLAVTQGVSPWWGWLVGMVLSAIVAVIIALATRKLSGFYLAAVTLLFALAFEHWLGDADSITGGSSGISAIPVPTFFGLELPRYALVVAAIAFVCLVAVLLDRLRRSAWGLSLSAARESTPAVQSSGISPTHLTVVALAAGAAIASTGGALFTASVQAVTPETFALDLVFLAIFMPIIGGRGSAWGAPLGALIVVAVTLNMPGYQGSGELLLAVVVLVILLLAPGGVIGWTRQAIERLRGKKG